MLLRAVLPPPNMLFVELRWTDWNPPMLARLSPEEERWKMGWLGRPGARDMRDPEVERAWFAVLGAPNALAFCIFEMDWERFMADMGMGIAETLCATPSGYEDS